MTNRNLKEEVTLTPNGFLFDHTTGLTYTLNYTSVFIFKKIVEQVEANKIIKELVQMFDIDEIKARQDFEEFFEIAKTYGIL